MLVHELKLCACSAAAIWSKFSPVHTPLSKGLTAVAVFLAASPWPKGTMTKKNNKGKIAGSGTVSNARRERYKEACRERDRLLEQATTEEEKQKAKEAQKIKQRKPEEGARSSQVKVEELQHPWKKEQEVKAEQKQEAAPCQKEQKKDDAQPAAPCQKEQKKDDAQPSAPCQKEQKKDDAQPAAPCQKEQKKDDAQPSAPCQKEQKKDDAQPSAPGQKELGPSTKQEMLEHPNTKREKRKENPPCQKGVRRVSRSPESEASEAPKESKRAKQPEAPCQNDASSSSRPRTWLHDGHRWISKEEVNKRVAIDYYLTLTKGKQVHWRDILALQKLKDHGYYLILLSYCGQRRSEMILEELEEQDLVKYFDKIRFTWEKTGCQGKAVYCKDNHIPVLFDDSKEVVDECWEMGVYTYNMNSKWHVYTAGHWRFWQAVGQFLVDRDED